METIKKEKTFDAVKMMREIRDKIRAHMIILGIRQKVCII
jgi:hypothetical protein